MEKLKADESLDFHNKQIQEVALGERCKDADRSSAYIITSPLGHVYTNACPNGLHCVKLYGDTSYDEVNWDTKVDFIRASTFMPSNPHAKQLKKWLQMYFSHPIKCRDIELSFCGLEEYGEFNSKIWMTILDTCPPGELMSYSELARRSGYGAGASKVVGYAINKNPYMLVVGDHRVIKASGEIWCENESQRNKLRRLLVHYEIGFTDETFEEALLKVRERNSASKSTRRRNAKASSGGAMSRVKPEPKEEEEEEEEEEVVGEKPTGGIKKRAPPARKAAASKRGATGKRTMTTRRRRRKADTDEESEESYIDDDD